MRAETTGDAENTTSEFPEPPDTTPSAIPQILKSNSESAGSSDFDETAHNESPHNDPADDSDSPTVEIDTSADKADKQKKRPKKQPATASVHKQDEPRFSDADDDNDDDMDTTDFESSLAPRRENADHAST